MRYLVYLMSYAPLALLLSLLGPVYVAGLLVSLINYALVTIQRCHDLGLRGWWSLVLGLPGPNLALLVIPGKSGTNRFGDAPTVSRGEKLAAPVLVLLTIGYWGYWYTHIVRPAFDAYKTRTVIGTAPWERSDGELDIQRFEFTPPRTGSLTLESGEVVPITFDVRSRDLDMSFELKGEKFGVHARYNVRPVSSRSLTASAL